ncbi:MAG TPA: bifunctional riboflavin kinase/FAD synthetase [Candidatus Acidoferrum sp.]|nr:bifunctional riboflavin kinase/FAD synthetase [Candidatus Acidoferrum sp.]
MQVVNIAQYVNNGPVVAALGNFDGVHRGHQSLLAETVRLARALGATPIVYTFSSHPANVLAGRIVAPSITTNAERLELFERLGIEMTVMDPFKPETASLAPGSFIEHLLFERLGCVGVVCGFHYHFGARGAGDAALIQMLCNELGMEASVMPPVLQDRRVISSTWIRECVVTGNVGKAAELMGHPYMLRATVVPGQHLGARLGIPTMNQWFPEEKLQPARGVYCTSVAVDGVTYAGATNVGTRPTVSGEGVNAETHLLGFSGDLYGRELEIQFLRKIRDERKFENVEALRLQLEKDVARCASLQKR